MNITLTRKAYRQFLIAFRAADIANAATGAETQVDYDASCSFFFEAPNFKLVAYQRAGQARVNLTNYNHVPNIGVTSLGDFSAALQNGGGTSTTMNRALSLVVIAISEAARSRVVEEAMYKIITGGSVNMDNYEFLFKAYNQPARYNGFLKVDSSYSTYWRPLKKEDYDRFFSSAEYTGKDMKGSLALV
ncbi:MAG TPA: hypothetical protein PKE57_01745 [Cellvibrionaceae bacterium]|nr:hypothetical protein [Cellvibrionaceae bacterium]HMW49192.1 hypothetical protein [Cellvibrionaceae bacterium]HMW70647.1 hypothetical protein [Cellvibrionaceae bacterium]HMY38040.1 hypothetical protein [Marinagarivorans sp.]HNG59308.1 hypothetical protein [Cellvibrionaceae bacterium]